jgi:tetratricopeptide (TPR) repeat protein
MAEGRCRIGAAAHFEGCAGEVSAAGRSGRGQRSGDGTAGAALAGAPAQPNALAEAADAEPGCGWCWEARAEGAVRSGNREEALAVFEKSRKAAGLDEASRARLQLMEAGVRQDEAIRQQALARLAKLTPSNIQVLSELAASSARSRKWLEAESAYKRILDLDPDRRTH